MKAAHKETTAAVHRHFFRGGPDETRTVGIGELWLCERPDQILVAYALGSCIGLTMYDPIARLGGMLHCALPSSGLDRQRALSRPGMFVDTGVRALLSKLEQRGAERSRLVAKAAGAGAVFHDAGMFQIGRRNIAELRKTLWKHDMVLAGHQLGGSSPRTLFLLTETGETLVRISRKLFVL